MSIKLDTFDYDLIEQYFLENISEYQYWLFGSHGSKEQKPVSLNNDLEAKAVLEKTVFGIKYNASDVSFMLSTVSWEPGRIYTQYDDTKVLKDTSFFVVIEPEIESGNYHIFKCLSNNNNSPSTEKPEFNPSIQDGIYILSDGYIWKFMTSTPFTLFRKFAAKGLLPILRNQQVEDIANSGIYNIVIENPNDNRGYERIGGIVRDVNIENGITRVFLRNLFSQTTQTSPIFEVPNTYSNRSLFIEKSGTGNAIAAVELEIRDSGVTGGIPFVTVSTPSGFTIAEGDIVEIVPKVVIQGNGSGATAIPIFDLDNQRIKSIRMITAGNNYTNAAVIIKDPVSFDPTNENRQDVRCIARPIISPKGGHGSNVFKELKSKHLGLSKTITSISDSEVPSSGTYSKISLVKEPVFTSGFTENSFDNRVRISLETIPADINKGDVVSQGIVTARVHEIDNDNNLLFLVDYIGPYDKTFVVEEPLLFQNINFVINSIEYPSYITRTGDVLTITDVTPIERDAERSEQIRLILDF